MAIAILSSFMLEAQALAQLQADTTSKTRIIQDTPTQKLIKGGRQVKGNLFHSFQDFSIRKAKETVRFVVPSQNNVTNIFARVTGKDRSRINGTIASDGQANLFLINPNGIIFQENAQLEIGGSFLATTGDLIQFENGQHFSAIAPQNTQLLTVKTPVGIQLGSNPGLIRQNMASLELDPNQQFILVGGELKLKRRRIAVPDGTVVLGALEPNQAVGLDLQDADAPLDFRQVKHFDNITFKDSATITTVNDNKNTQGDIQLWGNDISLNNGVRLRAHQNADIKIQASGTLNLDRRSRIVINTGTLNTLGNIEIQAKNLFFKDGSQIKTSLTGSQTPDENRKGGNIKLLIQNRLLLDGISSKSGLSSAILSDGFLGAGGGLIEIEAPQIDLVAGGLIRAEVFNGGEGGSIKILTDTLTLSSGSQISSTAVLPNNTGEAGSIEINANQKIALTGSRLLPTSQNRRQTAIRAEASGQGRAGSLDIRSPVLEILDGAQILTSTTGQAGSSVFQIGDRLLISGIGDDDISSGIFSDAVDQGISGPITINAPKIELNDGGLIRSQVIDEGQGANISINTQDLSIFQGSQISSDATNPDKSGTPGTLDISATARILVSGGIMRPDSQEPTASEISAQSLGNSESGNIQITTQTLNLNDGAKISNTTVGNTQAAQSSGAIELNINTLVLEGRNTKIESNTLGQSPAGNLSIRSQGNHPLNIIVGEGTEISASSSRETSGQSGTILLMSPTAVLLMGAGKVAAVTSGTGQGGSIEINSPTIQIQRTSITSESDGPSQAGDLVLQGNTLILRDRATLSTSSEQVAGGNIQLALKQLAWLSGNSKINAEAQTNGGNISSALSNRYNPWLIAPLNNSATISADSAGRGGNIDLTPFRVLGFAIVSNSQQIEPTDNQISASGRTPAQDGDINANLVTDLLPKTLPETPVVAASTLSQQCNATTSSSNKSTFRSIGQGGMNTQKLGNGQGTLWDDVRSFGRPTAQHHFQKRAQYISPAPLEAQGWIQPKSGKIHLVTSVASGSGIVSAGPEECDTVIGTAPSSID